MRENNQDISNNEPTKPSISDTAIGFADLDARIALLESSTNVRAEDAIAEHQIASEKMRELSRKASELENTRKEIVRLSEYIDGLELSLKKIQEDIREMARGKNARLLLKHDPVAINLVRGASALQLEMEQSRAELYMKKRVSRLLGKKEEEIILATLEIEERVKLLGELSELFQIKNSAKLDGTGATDDNQNGATRGDKHDDKGSMNETGNALSDTPPSDSQENRNCGAIAGDYVSLLVAKQKWRNSSRLFGYSEKMGRFKRFVRNLALVSKDDNLLAREKVFRDDYVAAITQTIASAENKEGTAAGIYADISSRLDARKSSFERASRLIRKPKVALARAGVGFGLMTIGALLSNPIGWAAIAAGGAVGVIGRFVGTEAIWDRVRLAVSGRMNNGNGVEYAAAANVFYNNSESKKMKACLGAMDLTDSATSAIKIEAGLFSYAQKSAKNRFWKRTAALVAAFVPMFAAKYFAGTESDGQGPAPKTPLATETQPPEEIRSLGDNTGEYTVPNGGGYWHIAKDIVEKNMPDAQPDEKAKMLPRVWQHIIKNHSKFGIEPGETHPYTGNGAPWLCKGADMKFTADDWKSFKDIVSSAKKPVKELAGEMLKGKARLVV